MTIFWLFRLGAVVAGALPLPVGYLIASWVASLAYYLLRSKRDTVKANLRQALGEDVDGATLARYARGVFRTGVTNYFELLRMRRFSAEFLARRIRFHGREHIEAAMAGGRGAVLVTAHLGSYESTAQMAALVGYKVLVPAEPIKPEALFRFVNGLRSSHGLRLVPAERGVMRQLVKALRRDEIVGLAVDRDAVGGGSQFEFFGRPTPLQPAAAALARRERAPVLAAFAIRRPDRTSDIYVEPPLEMQATDDELADLQVNMRRILAVFECYIRRYPDQWVAFVPVWPAAGSQDAQSQARSEARECVGQSRPSHP